MPARLPDAFVWRGRAGSRASPGIERLKREMTVAPKMFGKNQCRRSNFQQATSKVREIQHRRRATDTIFHGSTEDLLHDAKRRGSFIAEVPDAIDTGAAAASPRLRASRRQLRRCRSGPASKIPVKHLRCLWPEIGVFSDTASAAGRKSG